MNELGKFIDEVVTNRGQFKSNKPYKQLENIFYNGNVALREMLTHHKICGITLIEEVAIKLPKNKHSEWMRKVFDEDVVNVKNARLILEEMLDA